MPKGQVLVLGRSPDPGLADRAAEDADLVIGYDIGSVWDLLGPPVDSSSILDVSASSSVDEGQVWRSTVDLLGALGSGLPLSSGDVIEVMRRAVFAQAMLPIAVARSRAQRLAARCPENARLRVIGLSEFEVKALKERFAHVEVLDCKTRAEPRVRSRVARSLTRGSRTVAKKFLRARRSEGTGTWKTRAVHGGIEYSTNGQRLAVVVATVDQHMRLLQSTLAELESRGWRTALVMPSGRGAISNEWQEQFALSLQLNALAEQGSLAESAVRHLTTRRFYRLVDGWCSEAGLGPYSDEICSQAASLYYVGMARHVRGLRRAFRALDPDVVLTVSETGAAEAAVPVARRLGIPTVNVQHGVITGSPFRSEFRFDAFCVFGEAYAETLAGLGTERERIRVVGNPFMDVPSVVRRSVQPTETSEESTGVGPDDSLTVLFAAQHSRHQVSDYVLYSTLRLVLEVADQNPMCDVVVKLHPLGEGAELGYELALEEHRGANVTVVRDADLASLIATSDCVAVHSSTVAFDAMASGKPAILVNPTGATYGTELLSRVTDLHARDSEGLARCFEMIRSGYSVGEDRWRALEPLSAFNNDGLAGKRIADVCEELSDRFGAGEACSRRKPPWNTGLREESASQTCE